MTTDPAAATEVVATRDGYRLHLERRGEGRPVVVFEAGMGVSSNMWGGVLAALGEPTTTVVYDRSGLGQSPPNPGPRDVLALADDLVDVLDHLGEGPFVLVGHSWGGPVVRVAAADRPDRIAGLVLVDVTDERCDLFFGKGNQRQLDWSPRVLPILARLGLARRLVAKQAALLPEPWRSRMLAQDGTAAATKALLAELACSIADLRRLREHPLDLPDVPVTFVSGTRAGFGERGRRPELLVAHRASAAALPQGRFVEATGSSHYVPFSEPDLVAEEIRRVLDRTGH